MLFGHEHDHDTLHSAPCGSPPLWGRLCIIVAFVLVAILAQPWRPW